MQSTTLGPKTPRPTPLVSLGKLSAIFLLGLALILLYTLFGGARPSREPAGESAEIAAGVPALGTPGFVFDPPELRVKAGQPVELRLDNRHAVVHSFDLDELNVHVPAPPGQSALIHFTPE